MTNFIVTMSITRVLYIVKVVCSYMFLRLFIDLFLLCVYHLSLCVIIICNTKIRINICLSYVYVVYCLIQQNNWV